MKNNIKIVVERPPANVQGELSVHLYINNKLIRGTTPQPEDPNKLPAQIATLVYEYVKQYLS